MTEKYYCHTWQEAKAKLKLLRCVTKYRIFLVKYPKKKKILLMFGADIGTEWPKISVGVTVRSRKEKWIKEPTKWVKLR